MLTEDQWRALPGLRAETHVRLVALHLHRKIPHEPLTAETDEGHHRIPKTLWPLARRALEALSMGEFEGSTEGALGKVLREVVESVPVPDALEAGEALGDVGEARGRGEAADACGSKGEALDAPDAKLAGRGERGGRGDSSDQRGLERVADSLAEEAFERLRALTVEALKRRLKEGRASLMSDAVEALV